MRKWFRGELGASQEPGDAGPCRWEFYSECKETHGNILGQVITRHSFCFSREERSLWLLSAGWSQGGNCVVQMRTKVAWNREVLVEVAGFGHMQSIFKDRITRTWQRTLWWGWETGIKNESQNYYAEGAIFYIYKYPSDKEHKGIKSLHIVVTKSLEIGITRNVHCLYE